MVITPHANVGATVGSYSGSVVAAFALGWASHYLLDALPHRDYALDDRRALIADSAAALLLVASRRPSPRSFAGALGGITPDLIAFGLAHRQPAPLRQVHDFLHTASSPSARASFIGQGAVTAIAWLSRR